MNTVLEHCKRVQQKKENVNSSSLAIQVLKELIEDKIIKNSALKQILNEGRI